MTGNFESQGFYAILKVRVIVMVVINQLTNLKI